MLFAIVKNSEVVQTIRVGKPFSFEGKEYSHKWYIQISKDKQAEMGIQEVVYGNRADERYYWVTEQSVSLVNGVPTVLYTATAKDLNQLKESEVAKTKEQANSELSKTDWMVIRKAERGIDVPSDVIAERQEIVDHCNTKEAAINAATNIDELIAAANLQRETTTITNSVDAQLSFGSATGV